MSEHATTLPSAFVSFDTASAHVVCDDRFASPVRAALEQGSLYDFARSHPSARVFAGRGPAYAVCLPGDPTCVIVRHNRHGGLLASFTGDLFRWPSRAPLELENSRRLLGEHVPTPELVCFALYRAPAGFCRADVVTVEVPASHDLSTAITSPRADHRARALHATARLVQSLTAAGARHHDLNVKNVLLRDRPDGGIEALVLDVDRVVFSSDRVAVREANLARLVRSARKWRDRYGAPITDAELAELAALVRGPELSSARP
jgi:lipopolysaccharide kinase (Kdo/WaaP) family protein